MLVFNNIDRLWIFKTHGILNVSHGVSAFTKKGFDAAASFFLLD